MGIVPMGKQLCILITPTVPLSPRSFKLVLGSLQALSLSITALAPPLSCHTRALWFAASPSCRRVYRYRTHSSLDTRSPTPDNNSHHRRLAGSNSSSGSGTSRSKSAFGFGRITRCGETFERCSGGDHGSGLVYRGWAAAGRLGGTKRHHPRPHLWALCIGFGVLCSFCTL